MNERQVVSLLPPASIDGMGFTVTPQLWEALLAHAQAAAPEECCAIGIGRFGEVTELHLVPNVHPEPITRYEIAAADQLAVYERAEEHEWQVTLVFHSHPATEPVPSATDRSLASWPGALYAILSLANPDEPLLRAWKMTPDPAVEPIELPVELP